MRIAAIASLFISLLAAPLSAQDGFEWSSANLTRLEGKVEAAALEALPRLSADALVEARESGDADAIEGAATDLALRLARMHLLGAATSAERRGWHIEDTDRGLPLEEMLSVALANDTLDTFFALMRPRHPQYSALLTAYQNEDYPERQATIARNMERWRWLPRSLGEDYVIVNAARFEADLWRDGDHEGTWRVIVGTQRTPTPVFQATIEGVVLNPWWEIPASIVRESVGALVRNNPSLARSRGYVVQNGRYRQRPGPNNALGQMKLVMPNPYSVYMHDTPNRQLFEEEVRTFSHGCIRTGDAIGFASTLLEGVATRDEIDAILETQQTTTLSIAERMPIYVTYFTAVAEANGDVVLLDDIYGRDPVIRARPVRAAFQAGGASYQAARDASRTAAVSAGTGCMAGKGDI